MEFRQISFKDYCRLVSERLGIEFGPINTYKLTDLKPFLGAVHEPELRDYEFWSFGDLDLCYGDLSMLLNERMLKRYDLITTHNYHIAGHFTVIKNNGYYRNLCFKIRDWEKRLSENIHYGFDEGDWSGLVFPKLKYVRAIWNHIICKLKVVTFNAWMDFGNSICSYGVHFREYFTSLAPHPGETWVYCPRDNRVVDHKGRELPYLHFLFFKKTKFLDTDYYWQEGYYHLGRSIGEYSRIFFDREHIYGEK
jgi:hypothetical protein